MRRALEADRNFSESQVTLSSITCELIITKAENGRSRSSDQTRALARACRAESKLSESVSIVEKDYCGEEW